MRWYIRLYSWYINQNTTGTAATVTGAAQTNITSVGTLTALDVDNINLNGNTLTTTSSDFIIDASHDINLDAGGGDWRLKSGGSTLLTISNVNSGDMQFLMGTQEKDYKFVINDGGSQDVALLLDGSDNGTAYFSHDIRLVDHGQILLGAGADLKLKHDATNSSWSSIHDTGDLLS